MMGIDLRLIALNVHDNVGIKGIQHFGAPAGARCVVSPSTDVFVGVGLDSAFDVVVVARDDDLINVT